MKIILREDVAELGKTGDMVKVKDGYARNYLIPRKLAVVADADNIQQLDHQKKVISDTQSRRKRDAEELAKKIEAVSCTIAKPVGEKDKLFGSVTTMDIEKILQNEGLKINKKQILLDQPIKVLGVYTVLIDLHPEVQAKLKVWVVKE
jgi:large subunit ribosomal protein L9